MLLEGDAQRVETSPLVVQAIMFYLDAPERVDVQTMTPLLVDETETGTAGWILGIEGDPADGYLFVDESHANLFCQTIVAVSGGVETGRTGSSFRFCFGGWQGATRRK